jgi:5-methylcytosine-specific restriction enzyme subunit McrC
MNSRRFLSNMGLPPLGVLIDMAEVWGLYIYHLLRSALRGVEVVHAGRDLNASNYLLRSDKTGERLGGLKPDILILAPHANQLLAILDAKYKTTARTPERPHGIQREDLYQLATYQSGYGRPTGLSGGLAYPATQGAQLVQSLSR